MVAYEPPMLHVAEWKQVSSEPQDSFTLVSRQYILDDDTRYDLQIYHPHKPKFDIAATYTTPWCTDLGGFNQIMGEALADQGMVVAAVSPERLKGAQLLQRFGSLALEHDVHAQLAILESLDEETRTKPGTSIDVGYSRGAMVGFGVNVYSSQYGRDIAYSDYIDPCLAHGVGVRDVNWPEIPGYLGREVFALAKGLAHSSPATLRKMARYAMPPSATFWLQQVAVGKALFSGQAGDFITEMHPDTPGHVTLYTSSRFNHAADYQDVLSRYPHIVTREEPGYHLTGVEPRVRHGVLGRIVMAQHLLHDNASPSELAGAMRSVSLSVSS